MSENTKIEWTHHTFNPWWGCTKVSPACDNCYAETLAARLGKKLYGMPIGWGPEAQRGYRPLSRAPETWNRSARLAEVVERVFCASMCDVFEGKVEQKPYLEQLWPMIERTTNLDWLLLTKRANNITRLTPWGDEWPDNVWTGATVENQEWADKRLPHLLKVPSAIRFVSVEPMFTAVDLRKHLGHGKGKINWVICGGESGNRARVLGQQVIDWYRDLRDQCVDSGVPFFFKQWGNFGQNMDGDLVKLRAKNAENLLDGIKWEQFPTYRHRHNRPEDEELSGVHTRADLIKQDPFSDKKTKK